MRPYTREVHSYNKKAVAWGGCISSVHFSANAKVAENQGTFTKLVSSVG